MPKMERTEVYMKEIDDVLLLVVDLLKKLRAGVPITEALIGELQNAMNAIGGATDIPQEFKDEMAIALRTVGARMGELAGIFVTPPVPQVAKEVAADPA